MKQFAAFLELEGLQELKIALTGTPASQLVNLIAEGIHWAGEATPSHFVTLTPTPSKWQVPASVALPSKRACCFTITIVLASKKEEESSTTDIANPNRPYWDNCGPHRELNISSGTTQVPSNPM